MYCIYNVFSCIFGQNTNGICSRFFDLWRCQARPPGNTIEGAKQDPFSRQTQQSSEKIRWYMNKGPFEADPISICFLQFPKSRWWMTVTKRRPKSTTRAAPPSSSSALSGKLWANLQNTFCGIMRTGCSITIQSGEESGKHNYRIDPNKGRGFYGIFVILWNLRRCCLLIKIRALIGCGF